MPLYTHGMLVVVIVACCVQWTSAARMRVKQEKIRAWVNKEHDVSPGRSHDGTPIATKAYEISFGPKQGRWAHHFSVKQAWAIVHGTPIATFWLVDPMQQPMSLKKKGGVEKASYNNPFCGNWFPSPFDFSLTLPNGHVETYPVKTAEAAIFLSKANILGDRERKNFAKKLKKQNKAYDKAVKADGDLISAIHYSDELQKWQRAEFATHPNIYKWFDEKTKTKVTLDVVTQKFNAVPRLCALLSQYPAETKFVEATTADKFFGVGMQAGAFLKEAESLGKDSKGLTILRNYGSSGGIGLNILGVALTEFFNSGACR